MLNVKQYLREFRALKCIPNLLSAHKKTRNRKQLKENSTTGTYFPSSNLDTAEILNKMSYSNYIDPH